MNRLGAVALVWACFLARAIFYASALPMWEGFDEYSHFAVIQHIAFQHDLPDHRTANSSRQVGESLKLVPAPWLTHYDEKRISYEDYWSLPLDERSRREAALRSIPADWERDPADPPIRLWEAQQPPLFYWIMTPFYWAIRGLSLPAQVWILRCLAALIASSVIPLTVMTGRELGNPELGLGAAIVLTAMPELMLTAGRISNECLAIAMGVLAVLAGVRIMRGSTGWRDWLFFGVAIGAALLTKAYFLVLIPWAFFVFYSNHRSASISRDHIARAASAIAVFSVIAGWWYVRIWLTTGTITGEQGEVAARAGTTISLLSAIRQTPWTRVADLATVSYIWLGGWSFLVVRSWMYRVVELVIAVAAIRLIWRRQLLLLVMPVGLLAVGLAYHATTGVRTYAGAGTLGYYFYAFAAAEGILLVAGWGRFWQILVPMFLALEGFAIWFVQLPYYAGFTRHVTGGGLPALQLRQLSGGGFRVLLEHLARDKPYGAVGMLVSALAFYCATAVLLAVTFRRSKVEKFPVLPEAADSPAWR